MAKTVGQLSSPPPKPPDDSIIIRWKEQVLEFYSEHRKLVIIVLSVMSLLFLGILLLTITRPNGHQEPIRPTPTSQKITYPGPTPAPLPPPVVNLDDIKVAVTKWASAEAYPGVPRYYFLILSTMFALLITLVFIRFLFDGRGEQAVDKGDDILPVPQPHNGNNRRRRLKLFDFGEENSDYVIGGLLFVCITFSFIILLSSLGKHSSTRTESWSTPNVELTSVSTAESTYTLPDVWNTYNKISKAPDVSLAFPPQQNRVPLGLYWFDNNCFFISIVQALAWMLPPVHDTLAWLKQNYPEEKLLQTAREIKADPSSSPLLFFHPFLTLIDFLQSGQEYPKEDIHCKWLVQRLTRALWSCSGLFRPKDTADAHEVMTFIVDHLDNKIIPKPDQDRIAQALIVPLRPDVFTEYYCSKCRAVCSSQMELTAAYAIGFAKEDPVFDVQQKLDAELADPDEIEDVKRWEGKIKPASLADGPLDFKTTCRYCKEYLRGHARYRAGKCPPVLPLVIIIPTMDFDKGLFHGLPLRLPLDNLRFGPCSYSRLEAFVVQEGGTNKGGHYTTWLRAPGPSVRWYHINNETVRTYDQHPELITNPTDNHYHHIAVAFYGM